MWTGKINTVEIKQSYWANVLEKTNCIWLKIVLFCWCWLLLQLCIYQCYICKAKKNNIYNIKTINKDLIQYSAEMESFVHGEMHSCTFFVLYFGTHFPNMSPKLMFNHLKVGFQRPDDVIDWRWGFRSRWSDNRKKVTATTPRMTTPEIRALVTGFIGWELAGEAGKCSVERSPLFMPASYYMTLHDFHLYSFVVVFLLTCLVI